MKIHIYKIYFPTSKKCYIGQTACLEKRLLGHLNSKYLVGNALRKYDDWQVSVFHTCKSRDEANRIEIEEIRNHNSVAPNGYNLTRGGEGVEGYQWTENQKNNLKGRKSIKGYKHTEETNEKNRKARQGNQNTKGKHWELSKETRGKQSSSHIGKHHSKETIEKMKMAAKKSGIKRSITCLKKAIEKLEQVL